MAHDLFESPKFLVRQTRERVSELYLACEAIFANQRSTRVTEIHAHTGKKTFKVKYSARLTDRERHIVASAVLDLRHALDQVACAAVEALTGADAGLIYFPIAANANDLRGRLKKSFPAEIHAALERSKAYPGGNDLLCALAKAAHSKHRASCKVAANVIFTTMHDLRYVNAYAYELPPLWDAEENEMILGSTAPDGHIEGNFNPTFYVAFDKAGPLDGFEVFDTLGKACDMIEALTADVEGATLQALAERG